MNCPGASASQQCLSGRLGWGGLPRAPCPHDASSLLPNKRGDWAEGQEFKSLFYSERGGGLRDRRGAHRPAWILVFSF